MPWKRRAQVIGRAGRWWCFPFTTGNPTAASVNIGLRARLRNAWTHSSASGRSAMAHNQDGREWLKSLNASGAEYVVIVGVALAHHGFIRYTGDIDVLVRATADNA
ncbi:MAG: hypothetical protein FGM37_00670 [Phycisphaerales bacterium]|nr:hypothetical protein [Phycisphaerales bacterium]